MVSMAPEHRLQEGRNGWGDIWGARMVQPLLLHLPGVYGPAVGDRLGMGNHAWRARMFIAASKLRTRIRAAPRLDTSSILRTVYSLPLASKISATWSVVYRVQTAAKGIELDELQVLPGPDKLRRSVEPGW